MREEWMRELFFRTGLPEAYCLWQGLRRRERSGPGLPFGADGRREEGPGPRLCPNNGNCVGRTGRPAAGEEIGS